MTAKAWFVIGIELLLSGLVISLLVGQLNDANKRADDAELLAKQRKEIIDDMTARQRDNAALDAKYTGELADAKETIERLRGDVADGRKCLQLKASCPKGDSTGSGSLGDASSPRLDDSAERDYWSLRSGIATVTKQVNYLQDYIRQQCLR